MATDTAPITEHGVATLPEQAWERARRRAEIIGPLAQSETVGHEAADAAAQVLGLSRRQVYILIRRARQGSGLVTDLVLGQSSGGKGKGRLPEPIERIIRDLLQKRFLTKQKRSLAAFHREVAALQIGAVHVGDLEFAARRRLDRPGDAGDVGVVEIEPGHRPVRFRFLGLFLDRNDPLLPVELDDAVPLRIGDVIGEDRRLRVRRGE